MSRMTKSTDPPKRLRAPARTLEARENQLMALAVDLAEKQLIEGNASAQVITHYLKLAATPSILEKEKLKQEVKLLQAKTEALQSAKKIEELYMNALNAMHRYSGRVDGGEDAEVIDD